MSMICVPVPSLQVNHTLEVEITLDGQKHVMNYRVESFPWPEHMSGEERIDHLRQYIRTYEADWELVQIGPPGGGLVPVTFRQRVVEPVDSAR